MKQTMYLVIRSDRSCRIAKKPRLAADEVAIPVDLIFPSSWGSVLNERITLTVPDFAPEVVHQRTES